MGVEEWLIFEGFEKLALRSPDDNPYKRNSPILLDKHPLGAERVNFHQQST